MRGVPFGGLFYQPPGSTEAPVALARDKNGNPSNLISLKTPEAIALADLVSVHGDLSSALSRCDRYLRGDLDDVARDAVFEAIVITYARPFVGGQSSLGKGARRRIDELLDQLSDDQRRAHDHVIHLRHQHVGHRVNEDEGSHVLAAFDADGQFESITPLMTHLGSTSGLTSEIQQNATILMGSAERLIETEIDTLRASMAASGVTFSDF